jgi:hypothetical protein
MAGFDSNELADDRDCPIRLIGGGYVRGLRQCGLHGASPYHKRDDCSTRLNLMTFPNAVGRIGLEIVRCRSPWKARPSPDCRESPLKSIRDES